MAEEQMGEQPADEQPEVEEPAGEQPTVEQPRKPYVPKRKSRVPTNVGLVVVLLVAAGVIGLGVREYLKQADEAEDDRPRIHAGGGPEGTPFGGPPSGFVLPDAQHIGQWNAPGVTDFKWNTVEVDAGAQVTFDVAAPVGHKYLTIVIEDQNGKRVRNLASMRKVEDFGGNPDPEREEPQRLTLAWNGCDEDGKPVPNGSYRVRGLTMLGLKATFDYAWYNPGMPPWQGYANSGWGGDHAFPTAVACPEEGFDTKWRAVIGGPCAEGGSAVLALDPGLKKCWGFKRHWWGVHANALTIVDNELWMFITDEKALMKMEVGTARVLGFQRPAGVIEEVKLDENVKALAVAKGTVLALTESNKLLFLNREKGTRTGEVTLAGARDVCFDWEQQIIVSTARGLIMVGRDGTTAALEREGLGSPGAMAVDLEGNLYVMDLGADYQVKVYSALGRPRRTIGTKGGQQGEKFDPNALHSVSSIALGRGGQLWVVESSHPRRVAVFDAEGKLARDFVGNTQYGASHLCLHEQDPTLACGHGVIFKLDPEKTQDYRPLSYMNWKPEVQSPFDVNGGCGRAHFFHRGMMLRSEASGKMREYYVGMSYGGPVLYLEKQGKYVPVAAVGTAECSSAFPAPEGNNTVAHLWSDKNEDQLVQEDELQALGEDVRLSWFYGWTHLLGPGLEFYVGGRAIRPVRFTAAGAPLYDLTKAEKLATEDSFIRVGEHLVGAQDAEPFKIGKYLFADLKGNVTATYPVNWTGVHGSMHSPVPTMGQTCGELFFAGAAKLNDELGCVLATQGNMGQLFLFTEDGLFIGSVFKDRRDQPAGWGTDVSKGVDWTGVTMLQEPFGGWFGKQDDGAVRCMFGRNAALVARIEGLDEVKRFDAGLFALDRRAAGVSTGPTATTPSGETSVLVRRLSGSGPRVDGDFADWEGLQPQQLKSGENVVGSVAIGHNGTRLFLFYTAQDASPLKNAGRDYKLHFKNGDALDLLLGPLAPGRTEPVEGDVRALFVPTQPSPTAVQYRAVVPGTPKRKRVEFSSPVRKVYFDSVGTLSDSPMAFRAAEGGYVCETSVPLAKLGVTYKPGLRLRGDVGILFSNEGGLLTEQRVYLFNRKGNVVADTPTEAELTPALWGQFVLE